jgi:hypothetical protein
MNPNILKKGTGALLFFLVFIVLSACTGQNRAVIEQAAQLAGHDATRLNEALRQAGNNRGELQKVLDHYSANEADSMKLRAAVFLIENMPGHYSIAGEEVDRYRKKIEANYQNMDDNLKKVIYTVPFRKGRQRSIERVMDIEVIRADYLISVIDNAIEKWELCQWLDGIEFEDFCDYVLPYRLDFEPLFPYNDSLMTTWKGIEDEIERYPEYRAELKDVWRFHEDFATRVGNPRSKYKAIMEEVNKEFNYDCFDEAFFDVINTRAAGIPSSVDLVPFWANRNGSHSWKVTLDPKFMNVMVNIHGEEVHSMTGKIYRITYSHNPIPQSNGKDYIPEFFRVPFHKDVTDAYMNTADVEIDLNPIRGRKPDHLYLSVFNNKTWQPVAWTETAGRDTVLFKKMGPGIIYLPVYYRGDKQQSTRIPFLLGYNGKAVFFEPDTVHKVSIRFVRKYPMAAVKLAWNKPPQEHRFEASDFSDFRKVDTVFAADRINPTLGYTSFDVPDKNQRSRYWRVISDQKVPAIAEIEFFRPDGKTWRAYPIIGEGVGGGGTETIVNAFDNNVLTYTKTDVWYGADLGSDATVNRIRYIPRTDANNIFAGHTYQLLYYDGEWKSVEVQEAANEEIVFHQVPSNAVYWLRNLNEGNEERVFIYKKGKIYWY